MRGSLCEYSTSQFKHCNIPQMHCTTSMFQNCTSRVIFFKSFHPTKNPKKAHVVLCIPGMETFLLCWGGLDGICFICWIFQIPLGGRTGNNSLSQNNLHQRSSLPEIIFVINGPDSPLYSLAYSPQTDSTGQYKQYICILKGPCHEIFDDLFCLKIRPIGPK